MGTPCVCFWEELEMDFGMDLGIEQQPTQEWLGYGSKSD